MRKQANTVLIIDGDPQTRRFISAGLKSYNYRVREAETGAAGLDATAHFRPDMILLDLDLPDMNGVEVLETIRSWSNVPVIVHSVEADEEQKVHLLKIGADDYVVKPYGIAELAARFEAHLRRYLQKGTESKIVKTGPLVVDLESGTVTLEGKYVAMTRHEHRLLHTLASHLGLALTHAQLSEQIWRNFSPDNIQYLRMLAQKVRRKIETDPSDPQLIISEPGVGYRLARNAVRTRTWKPRR
jgi:two-component system, OmpR family, KDP operon response regulator KdpE